ncbi:Hypothetical predicted protein [Mytilus galloprovincialis]|uniref:Novel STAND NTPase 3 domain-containing protein n=1 Tax=Mytilus galloprovincialis TaxID=29158 RepID=A0A8B6DQY6_MYTGA|nr:Hypothetical predicted protein [Mytilus galloprovincialis]
MAPISEEEENYVRLALLLKGVAPRAIRTYFDRTFPPTYLPSTLNTHYDTLDNLKFRRVLNQTQWNLLFPTNGQIKEELEIWAEDDKMFIETNGAKSVLKRIKENGCVVVTGSSGTGKSSLVRHVALQMQESYEIIPVTNPEDIIHWYNPSKQILFVVDDFCGTYTINPMKFESWKNQMEKIKSLVEKKLFKLIMSCRLQVYKDEKNEIFVILSIL